MLRRINESTDDNGRIRRILTNHVLSSSSSKQIEEYCCSLCGLNHQARDFIRAMLLYLIDQLEESSKFVKLLKNNQFLTQEAYQRIAEKIEARNQVLAEEEKKSSNHLVDIVHKNATAQSILPKTSGCEE